jgi:hypothetical protein
MPNFAAPPEGTPHEHEHAAPVVHRRYAAYSTTPLTATVKRQRENTVVLKVESADRRAGH